MSIALSPLSIVQAMENYATTQTLTKNMRMKNHKKPQLSTQLSSFEDNNSGSELHQPNTADESTVKQKL